MSTGWPGHLKLYGQSSALEHFSGPRIRRDAAGRTVIQVAADDWLLERLLTFDAGSEDLEDGGDAEPDCGPVVLSFDRAAAKRVYRGRQPPDRWIVPS